MDKEKIKPVIVLAVCIIITFVCSGFAAHINGLENAADSKKLVDLLGFAAILAAMVSILPLFLLLTQFRPFENLAIPLKSQPKMLPSAGRAGAIFSAMLFSGVTFFLFFWFGWRHAFPLPEKISLFIEEYIFLIWLAFIALTTFFALRTWFFRGHGRKADWTLGDLGLEGHPEKELKIILPSHRSKRILPSAIIAALILTGLMCILLFINSVIFKDTFVSVVLQQFNPLRFLVYLPFFAAFFTINAGIKLYGQMRLHEYKQNKKKSPGLTQLAWWGFGIIVILGGLILAAMTQYIADNRNLPFSLDGLQNFIFNLILPLFVVLLFFSTWFYRKSGTIYTGSFVSALLAALVFAVRV